MRKYHSKITYANIQGIVEKWIVAKQFYNIGTWLVRVIILTARIWIPHATECFFFFFAKFADKYIYIYICIIYSQVFKTGRVNPLPDFHSVTYFEYGFAPLKVAYMDELCLIRFVTSARQQTDRQEISMIFQRGVDQIALSIIISVRDGSRSN